MPQISIRMDSELRNQTEAILSKLGLTMSSAFNIFAHQIVSSRGIPFPLVIREETDESLEKKHSAVKMFLEFAENSPVKIEDGFVFNREELYERN